MAYIKINLDAELMDGHNVTFKAPCDCTQVEGLKVCYIKNNSLQEKIFTMKDARGETLTGIGNLFAEGSYVHAILDSVNQYAYLQNAANNGYLDLKIVGLEGAVMSHEKSINELVGNQIPEKYLKESVDKYISENKSGLATKEDVEELESELSDKIVENVNKLSSEIDGFKDDITIIIEPDNILNKELCEYGMYITTSGVVKNATDGGNWVVSPLIKVPNDRDIYIKQRTNLCFFDEDKNFISNIGSVGSYVMDEIINAEDIPNNTSYIRFTMSGTMEYLFNQLKNRVCLDYDKGEVEYFEPYYSILTEDIINTIKNSVDIKTIRKNENKTKRCLFLGDSVTWGYNDNINERVEKPYPDIIKDKYGFADCINKGISGSTIGGDGVSTKENGTLIGYQSMVSRIDNLTETSSDIDKFILFGGTNDCMSGVYVPLGTKEDKTELTFYGALNIITNKMIEKFMGCELYICTPLHRGLEINNSTGNPNNLSEYVDAIRYVGNKKGIKIIDLYAYGEFYAFNANFRNKYSISGLHPNQDWYYILADKIGKEISEF